MQGNSMAKSFSENLIDLLKMDSRFVDDEGELIKAAVIDRAWKIDRDLVKLLLSKPDVKEKFFDEIEGHWIFNINTFIEYISDKNFLANSYTRFRNKIGLNIDGKFLRERGEVSLVWPYKDCVLEGGQTKEEEKRKEIFFNEILAQDEIDRLFDPKVLTNWKRYTPEGEQKVSELKRDENGTIRENLIIKGNNLLALHTLKTQFRGKVKLIYIDPPYNTGNDSFGYNDNFNHSSWLTFMKNRLEVARRFLQEDGVIFVQCDDNEQAYLKVLMDEIFERDKFVGVLVWQRAKGGGQAKEIVKGHDYILVYKNFRDSLILKREKSIQKQVIEINKVKYIKNDDFLRKVFGKYSENRTDDFDRRCFYEEIEKIKGTEKKREIDEKIKSGECMLEKHPSGKHIVCRLEPLDQAYSTFYSIIKNVSAEDNQIIKGYLSEVGKYDLQKLGITGFEYPKPVGLVKVLIKSVMMFEKKGLILDFAAGSGTTAEAVLELNKEDNGNRQFILCEQLDYVDTVTVSRVRKVIENIGGGDFIYCELMKHNEAFMDKIQSIKTSKELIELWKDIAKNSFLNWYVNAEMPEDAVADFIEIGKSENGLEKQKKLLIELLNKNQLYVNLSEIDDDDFKVSEDDKKLNQSFYGEAYNG